MKRWLVLAALVAIAGRTSAAPLSADSVTDVFQAWHDALEEQAGVDVHGRGLLQDTGLSSVTSEFNTARTSVQTFLSNSLGSTWRGLVPSSWATPTFNWSSLREEVEGANVTIPVAFDEFDQLKGHVCKPEKFVKGKKPNPECSGPQVKLSYVPKTCNFTKDFENVTCVPANITLTKIPGQCEHALDGISTYVGKECAITVTFGHGLEKTKGGSEYPIALKPLKTVVKEGIVTLKDAAEKVKDKKISEYEWVKDKKVEAIDKIKDAKAAELEALKEKVLYKLSNKW